MVNAGAKLVTGGWLVAGGLRCGSSAVQSNKKKTKKKQCGASGIGRHPPHLIDPAPEKRGRAERGEG